MAVRIENREANGGHLYGKQMRFSSKRPTIVESAPNLLLSAVDDADKVRHSRVMRMLTYVVACVTESRSDNSQSSRLREELPPAIVGRGGC